MNTPTVISNVVIASGFVRAAETVGGVAGGSATLRATPEIRSCISNVTVVGSEEVGGIIGDGECEIYDCINNGNIEGDDCVGGIVGRQNTWYGSVVDCINNGNVTGNSNTGDLCGYEEYYDPFV